MNDIRKRLTNELEATTRGLQQQVSELQQDLTKLKQMVNNSSDPTKDQYQFGVWTQGDAAHRVAEIASMLSRARTLQEALLLLDLTQGQEEAQ